MKHRRATLVLTEREQLFPLIHEEQEAVWSPAVYRATRSATSREVDSSVGASASASLLSFDQPGRFRSYPVRVMA